MLKQAAAVLAALMVTASQTAPLDVPEVSAKAAVLIEAQTGRVLYQSNAYEHLPMASTTKIMSALLALEHPAQVKEFEVDSAAIRVEGSSMGLREGDIVTMHALACGMLLPSGNDAANAAAVAVCGSTAGFVLRMNERAAQLGLRDTHFANPSGLDAEGHYSTACDMARLAACALENEAFAAICSQSSIRTRFGNPPYERWMTNHNQLVDTYEGCIGVKTGFTNAARRCLVSAAERDGVRLICVTLNDPDDWRDHAALYDYGFENYRRVQLDTDLADAVVPVAGGDNIALRVATDQEQASAVISENELKVLERRIVAPPILFAPVQKGAQVGSVQYRANGVTITTLPLVAVEDITYKESPVFFGRIFGWLGAE
ncbi:MAG: D-alanyl-D-alanine carboxypeptidase family protein [Acetanaerobacterium sp.]